MPQAAFSTRRSGKPAGQSAAGIPTKEVQERTERAGTGKDTPDNTTGAVGGVYHS